MKNSGVTWKNRLTCNLAFPSFPSCGDEVSYPCLRKFRWTTPRGSGVSRKGRGEGRRAVGRLTGSRHSWRDEGDEKPKANRKMGKARDVNWQVKGHKEHREIWTSDKVMNGEAAVKMPDWKNKLPCLDNLVLDG